MDGVLCDFISEAMDAHGHVYDPEKWPRGEFDVAKVLGISASKFWERIDAGGDGFWAFLNPYPWAFQLVRELQQIDRVVIATSPSRSPGSYSGKRRWLIRHGLDRLDCMFGGMKYLMSQPGRTLIDDGEHNIKPWVENQGRGILFPQPWNMAEETDDVVKSVIANFAK